MSTTEVASREWVWATQQVAEEEEDDGRERGSRAEATAVEGQAPTRCDLPKYQLGSRPSRPQRDLGLRRREPDVRLRTGWARLSRFCKERHTPRQSWVRLSRLDALTGQLFVKMFLYQTVFISRSDSFCIHKFGTFFWELYGPWVVECGPERCDKRVSFPPPIDTRAHTSVSASASLLHISRLSAFTTAHPAEYRPARRAQARDLRGNLRAAR
jgi:hypothetical protein